MTLALAIALPFAAAALAPSLCRALGARAANLLALVPAAAFILLARLYPVSPGAEPAAWSFPWIPELGIALAFRADGLALLFALLISGIGTAIVVYAGAYLGETPRLGKFFASLFIFMGAMLGAVLADNLFALFVFWELTSFASFLLIGYKHESKESRDAALQALLVTGGGGLAMLAGFLLLQSAAGTATISELASAATLYRSHLLPAICILILAGAFTKSAQFPFHFWLLGAMQAPTPVSAYLHSATMVKLGVFLVARFAPILGDQPVWQNSLLIFGGGTMLFAAAAGLLQTDLKRILAYSTVATLSMLIFLYGIGTEETIVAATLLVLAHSLYKAPLFMTAGILDHGTGTRDITRLGGLARAMPRGAAVGTIAALSMIGLPPLLGFLSKELVYEAALHATTRGQLFAAALVATNALLVAAAAMAVYKPFFARAPRDHAPEHPHDASWLLAAPPLLLALLGFAAGFVLLPQLSAFIAAAAAPSLGAPPELKLKLWHGINTPLLLSIATVGAGIAAYAARTPLAALLAPLRSAAAFGPLAAYDASLRALFAVAKWQTRVIQSGYLRSYLFVTFLVVLALVGYGLTQRTPVAMPVTLPQVVSIEVLLALIIVAAALFSCVTQSRLAAIAAIGTVGFAIALIFLIYGAPDLAMTQFSVEVLSILLFALVLLKLPRIASYSSRAVAVRDSILAASMGALMTFVVLLAVFSPARSRLREFFLENSLASAYGQNVVNVILVDFRAFDTLGEIAVLLTSAIGVIVLLSRRRAAKGRTDA